MQNERPGVGVGVLVVRGDRFLLGKRRGKHMPGYYAAPGGHLEHGETFAQCAVREVAEETGLDVTNVRFLMIGNYKLGNKHYVDVDMVVDSPCGEPITKEPDKVAEWEWYTRESLPSPLFIVTKRMIEAYLNGSYADSVAVEQILCQG